MKLHTGTNLKNEYKMKILIKIALTKFKKHKKEQLKLRKYKLPPQSEREIGAKYMVNGEIRIWDGKILRCVHNRQKTLCKECGGGGSRRQSRCEHNRQKQQYKDCGGSRQSRCEHNRQKQQCKECGSKCQHNESNIIVRDVEVVARKDGASIIDESHGVKNAEVVAGEVVVSS